MASVLLLTVFIPLWLLIGMFVTNATGLGESLYHKTFHRPVMSLVYLWVAWMFWPLGSVPVTLFRRLDCAVQSFFKESRDDATL